MSASPERLRFELTVHRRAGLRRWRTPVAAKRTASRPIPDVAIPKSSGLFAGATSIDEPAEARLDQLRRVEAEVAGCTACKLCETRTKTVPGEGALDPPILFIGEGPGADEDRTGRPFVGRAGQLLDRMIAAIGLRREQVFIANVVKCRPPGNRTPEPDEVRACAAFLDRQIRALRPRLICTLGLPATRALLPEVRAISAARGRLWQSDGRAIVPTFHPAYLLRNPAAKHEAWEDLKLIARELGLELPPRGADARRADPC